MRRFITVILFLIISIYLGLKIAQDPGMAFFSYQKWSIEMPLWLAVLAFITVLYLIYLLASFANTVSFAWYRFKNWLRRRREHKAYSNTNRGLIELVEGDWQTAESYLLLGVPQAETPLINYLGAAKAAHEQGNFTLRDSYLQKAHIIAPEADIAIGLAEAQLDLQAGRLEQALAILQRLRKAAPKHKFILKLLKRLYIRLGEWRELLKMLPSLRKSKLITAEKEGELEARIYCEIFLSPESKNEGYLGLQNTWDCIPRKLRAEPKLISAYVKRLMTYPDAVSELEALINKTVKKTWDSGLVKLYGNMPGTDPVKQLPVAEAWLKIYPQQALLYLSLGRIAMRCQLWGKARSYFETSLKLEANAESYLEYGRLLEQLGEGEAAKEAYRAGLLFAMPVLVVD